jgi:hypothetical protein
MSQGTTEAGQDPTNGGAGGQGQDPTAGTQQGQDPTAGQGAGNGPAALDLNAITDPTVRAAVEAQQAELKRARDDAARYRTERNTHQQTLADLQRQSETAEQAATREAAEAAAARTAEAERLATLERENRDLKVGFAVTKAATDARAYNPDLVSQMVRDKVTLDDKGQPTNVQEVLTALKTSDPYLFRKARNDAGAGSGDGEAPPAGNMNDVIRGQLGARRGRPASSD